MMISLPLPSARARVLARNLQRGQHAPSARAFQVACGRGRLAALLKDDNASQALAEREGKVAERSRLNRGDFSAALN
jgi:hypothetical protein